MRSSAYKFSTATTKVFYNAKFSHLPALVPRKNAVLLTDENIFRAHSRVFKNWNVIVLKAGEEFKVQDTVDAVIRQLIAMKAHRQTCLVGVGGGVITDLTGFIASVFMRGIPFGFVPTTLLCLVDASIGGKNGIDVDEYKNMVGLVRQPSFIIHDYHFLKTLPDPEWRNGFAEIIKHAAIGNAAMFRQLEQKNISHYKKNKADLAMLVRKNAEFKVRLVKQDEFEKNKRRLLNFGHTIGHALENQYELSHGEAIALGMAAACRISSVVTGFKEAERVISLIEKYGLPSRALYNREKMFRVMAMDKKRTSKEIHFILLAKIGQVMIRQLPLSKLKTLINEQK